MFKPSNGRISAKESIVKLWRCFMNHKWIEENLRKGILTHWKRLALTNDTYSLFSFDEKYMYVRDRLVEQRVRRRYGTHGTLVCDEFVLQSNFETCDNLACTPSNCLCSTSWLPPRKWQACTCHFKACHCQFELNSCILNTYLCALSRSARIVKL